MMSDNWNVSDKVGWIAKMWKRVTPTIHVGVLTQLEIYFR